VLPLFEILPGLLLIAKMSHLLVLLKGLVVHLADFQLLVLSDLLLAYLRHGLRIGEEVFLFALFQVGQNMLLDLLLVFRRDVVLVRRRLQHLLGNLYFVLVKLRGQLCYEMRFVLSQTFVQQVGKRIIEIQILISL